MRSRSSLGQNPLGQNPSSLILKNNHAQNNPVKREVRWGADENRTYDREEGGLSPEPVVRRAGVDPKEPQVALTRPVRSILKTAMPTKAEQEMLERLNTIRAQTNETTKRAEEAATQARAKQARANTSPEAQTTIQYRGEAPVVNEQSLLETFATQSGKVMGGVAESAQVVGQNIQQVAAQNIQSLLNFSPFGGPAQAEAPRVDGPDKKNANTRSSQGQVQGPRPEGRSWEQIVTSRREGGRGGETGGGRG